MDDLNEMARLHSAGATVRHVSPFDDLPTHKNAEDLTVEFVKKWAVPYYMEITSYGKSEWINAIKEVKKEITREICLSLLGDFNWRTRLVGSYFLAVKGYREFIDIIGTHLLKSEVCCVGHIYSLTFAFFNDSKCINYLSRYLDYYLTKPSLYFDQKHVMETVLWLDKENNTDLFGKYVENWNRLQEERKKIEVSQAQELAKLYPELEIATDNILVATQMDIVEQTKEFSTGFFDEQIIILRDLNQYSR